MVALLPAGGAKADGGTDIATNAFSPFFNGEKVAAAG